jgi:hypothetical protein
MLILLPSLRTPHVRYFKAQIFQENQNFKHAGFQNKKNQIHTDPVKHEKVQHDPKLS